MTQLQLRFLIFTLLICLAAAKKTKGRFWWEENYPNLSCHNGYAKDSNSSGKNFILSRSEYCYNSNSWGCFKGCMLKEVGILEDNAGKRLFRKDMASELRKNIFSEGETDAPEAITKKIVTECSELLKKRNDKKKPPTCKEDNELFMCIERATRCSGIKPKKGKLITPVCHPEVVDHYYIAVPNDYPDKEKRISQYPSTVSCEWFFVKPTKEALSRFNHIKTTCSTDLRGCYKRCIFEHFGILKFVHHTKYSDRLLFTPEDYMVKILKSNLFVIPEEDSYEQVAKRILTQCSETLKNLKKKATCVEQNVLYMCIEKAMACPDGSDKLETGPLLTTKCLPEEYEYYFHPTRSSGKSKS